VGKINFMSIFKDIPLLPPDPILSLPIAFAKDPNPNKINLGIGTYKTAEMHSLVLTSVREAEKNILQSHLNKDYLPIEGDPLFLSSSVKLLFGSDHSLLLNKNFFSAQTVGGTGALRLGGEFLTTLGSQTIFLSDPSWPNHKQIFDKLRLKVERYPYFDSHTYQLNFSGMCEAIRQMPERSVILLHGCCHNPSGLDPSFEQWKELSDLIKRKKLIPFFDIAYQGFGKDVDADAQAIRYFASQGHDMLVAYSFSKNFSLYGERVGFLTLITSQPEQIPAIASQIKVLIRTNYSNPPLQGARIVSTILNSPQLREDWKVELKNMRERIAEMRKALTASLLVQGQDKHLSYLHQLNGLFYLSGLNEIQIERLKKEFAIYLSNDGRINVAGLNPQNIEYLMQALKRVLNFGIN
jgi:aspartate/tyrosine/aromatic aminotransferase